MKREKVVLLFTGGFESLYNLDKLSKSYDILCSMLTMGRTILKKNCLQ